MTTHIPRVNLSAATPSSAVIAVAFETNAGSCEHAPDADDPCLTCMAEIALSAMADASRDPCQVSSISPDWDDIPADDLPD